MNETLDTLLMPDDPPPFTVGVEDGASPFVLVADHAGKELPRRLGTLGLAASERERHIAWDIGASALAAQIAGALDAWVIRQSYSRLVIDCNRSPQVASSILDVSESTLVPGNVGITAGERLARRREIFEPYHARIAIELDRRASAARPTCLIAVHTFTPVFRSVARRWHIGVLYNRDVRFAHSVLELLRREGDLIVGDNEPYSVSDESDYTIPVHGEKRGLHHVGVEIRQDLVADERGLRRWSALLARVLPQAYGRLNNTALTR